jgi:hypothetical protein
VNEESIAATISTVVIFGTTTALALVELAQVVATIDLVREPIAAQKL